MILNVTYLLELMSKNEDNCNIMKPYDKSRDGFNLIRSILYLSKIDLWLIICHLTYLTFLINLTNQPFNQATQSILSINLQLNCWYH